MSIQSSTRPGCAHAKVRTFRSHPPRSQCLNCGADVMQVWITAPQTATSAPGVTAPAESEPVPSSSGASAPTSAEVALPYCPTCSPPSRETVNMVCQTCGSDYSKGEKP